jgi:hypothetical protein
LRPMFQGGNTRIDTVGVGQDADDGAFQGHGQSHRRRVPTPQRRIRIVLPLEPSRRLVQGRRRGRARRAALLLRRGLPLASIVLGDRKVHVVYFDVVPTSAGGRLPSTPISTMRRRLPCSRQGPGLPSSPRRRCSRSGPRSNTPSIAAASRKWSLVDVHDSSAEFFAVASAPTSFTARVGPDQLATRSGGEFVMPLRVWIADKLSVRGAAIAGRSVD